MTNMPHTNPPNIPGDLKFDDQGLIPAIVQDVSSGDVLMLGYMNQESLARTLDTGEVHFFSRSRGRLWRKGETSGHVLMLRAMSVDCDQDTLLVEVTPAGPTCHTGRRSCFYTDIRERGEGALGLGRALSVLERTVADRDRERPEGSYTSRLLAEGVGRIAQKVGEEAVECVVAATSENDESLAEESADLLYHLLVLLRCRGIDTDQVAGVLERRAR